MISKTALLGADFGPDLTDAILEQLREDVERHRVTEVKELRRMLRELLEEKLAAFDPTLTLSDRPAVILVVGVNGVGKTTTIGKFANYLRSFDKRVLVGAADTFRAAAVEQLATWATRRRRHREAAATGPRPSVGCVSDCRARQVRQLRHRDRRHSRASADQGWPHG